MNTKHSLVQIISADMYAFKAGTTEQAVIKAGTMVRFFEAEDRTYIVDVKGTERYYRKDIVWYTEPSGAPYFEFVI